METSKALELAISKELDLVEVSPNARPPVCKIMSWAKFKYELTKKAKSSSKGKSPSLKEMRFSPFTGEGDIFHKLKKVEEFLKEKHPVRLTIMVRGRVPRENIDAQLKHVLEKLSGKYETDQYPKFQGRNLTLLIYPAKAAKEKQKDDKKK